MPRYSYATIAPGPGAYDVLSGFAAQPRVPTARHSGAHTFGRRGETFWMKTSIQRLEKKLGGASF